ncbi:CG15239, partial [Drosophila busckii]
NPLKLSLMLSLLLLASRTWLGAEGKTTHRRGDKISENFKQLDLPPEEIDPNVAPPEPQTVSETSAPLLEAAAAAPAVESAAATVAAAVLDETVNEIASVDAVAVPEAAAASASAAAAVAAEPAVSAVTVAPVKPKPKPSKASATAKPDADKNPISRYCKCTESHCDCCRKFGLPLLPSGPGCAKIAYLGNDEMSVSLKFGEITLASRRISAKRARPICVGMPGGYSKFCGRVYGLSRAQENFKACLAFELHAEDEVEAQLPISCFKFGQEGLRVAEAEPLPTKVKKPAEEDDDDIFGFGAGGDDDDDEDEDDYDDADAAASAEDDETDDYAEADDDEAPEEADYGGFSLGGLLDELDDDEDEKPVKKPVAVEPVPAATDQTREHVELEQEPVQSKDDTGMTAAEQVEQVAAMAAEEATAATAAAADAVAPTTSTTTTTTTKGKKKAKKNKKKKKAAGATDASEGDFAYELLNGLLDFFN